MNVINYSILAPVMFVFIGIIMWLFLNFSFKKNETKKGVLILKLDINQRMVYRYKRTANNVTDSIIFHSKKKAQWVPLERLTKTFVGTPGEKWLRNSFVSLAQGEKNVKFTFTTKDVIEKTKTRFTFTINDIDGTDKFNMIIRWKQIDAEASELKDVNLLDVEKIAKMKKKYKGFVAFGLNEHIEGINKHMAAALKNVSSIRYKNMIVQDDVFIILFGAATARGLHTKIKTFKNEVTKNGYKIGVRSFFMSSAVIEAREIDDSKRVMSVVRALDYYLNLSLKTGKQFVDDECDMFNKEEYDEYIVETKNLRAATRAGSFELKLFPVKTAGSAKKVIEFVKPQVEGMSEYIFKELMRNKFNEERLINSVATEVAVNKRVKVPVIVDITAKWLIDNQNKINYKKAIYVIKLNMSNTAPFVEVIDKLSAKGFIFGLRITKFKDGTNILIKNIRPEFVIIDEKLSSVSTFAIYQQLFSIKTFSSIYNFKTIFENPPKELTGKKSSKARAEALGMKYYFNTTKM